MAQLAPDISIYLLFLRFQLIINLVDMNDNAPTFPLSQYIVQGIAETVAMGTDIIQGEGSRCFCGGGGR